MAKNTSPRPLVLCGPSGSGKSTLLKKLLEDYPNNFGFSVSHTTRLPRPGEIDGKHYHFTTVEEMKRSIEEGQFIENATFGGNIYGTSKAAVKTVHDQGKICVLDIDVQGVKQIKNTDLNPFYVFIKPPNLNVLEVRLRQRETETEDTLKRRLSVASHEVMYGDEPGNFDLVVLNDNLEHAYKQLKKFVQNYVLNGKQENNDMEEGN